MRAFLHPGVESVVDYYFQVLSSAILVTQTWISQSFFSTLKLVTTNLAKGVELRHVLAGRRHTWKLVGRVVESCRRVV